MARKTRYLNSADSYRTQTQIRFRNPEKRIFSGFVKFLYWIILLAFIGVITYSLFFSQFLAVTQVNINDTQKLSVSDVRETVESQISGKWLNFIPKNNILLISKNTVKRGILEKYKYAESVEIKKSFPHGVDIVIRERRFSLVFCSNGECYVVDDKGVIFIKADFEKNELGENDLPIIYDDSNKSIEIEQGFAPGYINYLLKIREKLKNDLGVDLERDFHTPQIASGDIRIKTTEGWLIYMDKNIPADKEANALKIVLENKIYQNKRSDLEYVDLRTENKVYYKFKN